jgi:hypothetical protein
MRHRNPHAIYGTPNYLRCLRTEWRVVAHGGGVYRHDAGTGPVRVSEGNRSHVERIVHHVKTVKGQHAFEVYQSLASTSVEHGPFLPF